jgi:hypothetical protein
MRARNADTPDEFLDSILPIVGKYAGPDSDPRIVSAMKSFRTLSAKDRAAAHLAMRNPGVGITLKQYGFPLLAAQVADLAICPLKFQRSVLKIRYQLDLFN